MDEVKEAIRTVGPSAMMMEHLPGCDRIYVLLVRISECGYGFIRSIHYYFISFVAIDRMRLGPMQLRQCSQLPCTD